MAATVGSVTLAVDSRPSRTRLLAPLLILLVAVAMLIPSTPVSSASSYNLEARYNVSLHLDWASRRLRVTTVIDLLNTTSGPVDRIRLNTVAAKIGAMNGLTVKVDGTAVKAKRTGQTIVVPLGRSVAPGGSARVLVKYRARLATTASGRRYLFATLGGVAQIYRFIPWLSRKIPFGSTNHGEPFLTPVSPQVNVKVSADRKLVWAASGRRTGKINARTFTFSASNVRDLSLVASPGFKTTRGSYKGRTAVTAYTRSGNGQRMVNLARQELARYEAKTGVRYPHPTYGIAETGGGLAMESPALIWIPRSRPAYDHPYLISHETAHQWWYSTVGNDQSTDAFADEAMADYFSRKAHLSIRGSRCKTDRLDREIRSYSDTCYFEVVYVQGARFLENLRKDFGDAKFKAAIRRYARDNRFKISSNIRLLEAFRAEMGDGVLKRYRKRFPSIY